MPPSAGKKKAHDLETRLPPIGERQACGHVWINETRNFFFNDTATTEIYTLSLHDALPISGMVSLGVAGQLAVIEIRRERYEAGASQRSEEHTSELQSHVNLVCRLLLE